ncbi:unnamed protein product [Ectocarpus sp. CCAP 1310/34]|nr:unnamed protein product [Ectocarpus sp. CCAP 1310/34]
MTSSMILSKVKQRPFLVGGVAAASLLYMSNRRRRTRFPEGEIWLDMDLSRPLSKTPPGVDLSFVSGEPQPLYFRQVDVVDALEMAAKDNRVRGVLGRFSYRSWGGGYLACVQEVRDAVTRFREAGSDASATAGEGAEADGQQRKRFTIAVADTFGEGGPAVGEYFLASAFEKVLVQKTGYVGLTGSGGQKLFFRGFLDKYGIKPEVFAREEYKSAAESLVRKAYSPHEREAMTSLLTSMLDDVADGVAASRGFKDRKDVYAIMHDCPLPATLALSANLIDGIMYEHDVESMVKAGFKAKTADAENDATAGEKIEVLKTSVDKSEDNVLSTFADSEGSKYTRVSMRDYIQKMRKNRASESVLDANMLLDSVKGAKNTAPKKVALVNANGAITRFADPGLGPGSAEQATSSALCKRLQEIVDDPSIGAVVLRVDSPGGSAVASDSIAAAVRRVRLAGKPVVCSMGDLAASGGYMIAAACDTIVAQPTTITGSIGVIAAKLSVQRLLKDWGIQVDSIELSENHLAFSPLQEFSPQQRSLMDKRVGEIYEDFVGGVATGRNMSVDEVLKVAKGRVWTGRQALDRGLVDELGGLNIAIAIAKKAGGLPEDALVVGAKRRSLAQAVKGLISGGGGSVTESTGGVRSVIFALADAIFGVDAMEALFSTISLLASANDLVEGRMPNTRVRAGQGDLEIDVEALFK